MKFDYAIGNPPYQEEVINNGRQSPVYNYFMDAAFRIANCVELITPARYLFNAGQTPKAWNEERLEDIHFKVLDYEPDASYFFSNTEIKGGIAITIRDEHKEYGKTGIFTAYYELKSVLDKVGVYCGRSIFDICIGAVPYSYTETLKKECPQWIDLVGESFDLRTNAFDKLAGKIFFEKPLIDKSIAIYGLYGKKRTKLWVAEKYINGPDNFGKYKILVSKANGAGKFGENLSELIQAQPYEGHTQSFISIGAFDSKAEMECLGKYIKTKFVRCMLGVLRTTPDTTPYKWKYVPLQDFTPSSDIDWSKSINEIDQQLYRKYRLTQEEIDFIESHVKEMV